MKKLMFAAVLSAAAASMTGAVLAQTPAPSPAQERPADRAQQEQQVTVVGCVQREADFRRARDAGKGGAVGTGVGAGNEFVLTNAMPKAPSGAAPGAAGTSGTAEAAYEITGSNEGKLSSYVGKRVEITGKLKAAETAAGRPTGGATAGQPPAGVDVASKDLKLRELEVASVSEASGGSCPTK